MHMIQNFQAMGICSCFTVRDEYTVISHRSDSGNRWVSEFNFIIHKVFHSFSYLSLLYCISFKRMINESLLNKQICILLLANVRSEPKTKI